MRKYIYKSIGLVLAITTFSSCLKDDSLVLDPDKGVNVIEFVNPTDIAVHGSTTALYTLAYEILPTATVQTIAVSYSGPEKVAPQDIEVNFGLGTQSVIDQYNTEQGKTGAVGTANAPYSFLPSNVYTLSATKVVIPKGQSKASFTIAFKTNLLVVGVPYALPLKITSVSYGTISGNFSNILLNVVPKNKYDGVYNVKGTMVDVTNPAFSHYTVGLGSTVYQMQLRTVTATSCVVYDPKYFNGGGYFVPFYTGSATSSFGSFCPIIEFGSDGKVVGVTNHYGVDVSSNVRNAVLVPDAAGNQYTAATKTMKIKYALTQKAGINPPLAAPFYRAVFDETWVFNGQRP
ncbi:DUF1735 domain-containing protein [Pedobacter polaris]|uniref:DUF1735 domain-containing protein n=1 Tax=Pedobacter polaris TaxID=2571273 RepID=A0A4V5P1I9_9SPHI|nr:DUF1735 domain-containing protein [Pedobacter polaris]TKC06666.1 DUF1735 domain-containing protein [Pedobacter polaris]